MNVYRGISETGCCGGFDDRDRVAIVVANTESEALGLVLEEYPTSRSVCWSVDLIDTSHPSVVESY